MYLQLIILMLDCQLKIICGVCGLTTNNYTQLQAPLILLLLLLYCDISGN